MTSPDPNETSGESVSPPVSALPDPAPATTSRRARLSLATEELLNRRLTGVMVQMRRAEFSAAEAEIDAILTEYPGYAPATELRGDVRQSRGDYAGAVAAWREALQQEPGRATAEMKLARATLEHAETKRRQQIGTAYAGADTAMLRSLSSGEQKKNVTIAVVASAAIPGLGQLINGETVKGIAIAASYFFGLLVLSFLPETKALFRQLTALMAPTSISAHSAAGPSPIAWFLLAVTTGIWIYSMVDAAMAAKQSAAVPENKSGWDV